jgi:peptidoglycan/xylan/chitin deacetylase (PgdA/CDA1 family)
MRLLDWNELGRLVESGITIGAHSCTHPHLTELAPDAAEQEIVASKARLAAELGVVPTTFAYPYGSYDRVARDAVARHFTYACSTELRMLSPLDDPALLPRLDSYYYKAPHTLEAFGTRRFRARLGLLASARNVRRSLARVRAR